MEETFWTIVVYAFVFGVFGTVHPDDCEPLIRELRDYQVPDEHVVQDCVMATAIAIACAPKIFTLGRMGPSIEF